MAKIKLAMCIRDEEYQSRLVKGMMTFYQNRFAISRYTQWQQLTEEEECFDVILCGDEQEDMAYLAERRKEPILCLVEEVDGKKPEEDILDMVNLHCCDGDERKRIWKTEKYQDLAGVVEMLCDCVGQKLTLGAARGAGPRIYGVYSLGMCEYQMPFAATVAAILGEKEQVLLLDLMENSGAHQLELSYGKYGLEELMVMAESGVRENHRMRECISHGELTDCVLPMDSSECIAEADLATYQRLLELLGNLGYETIVVNLGSRFIGFLEFLNQCQEVMLLQGAAKAVKVRWQEMAEELHRRGYGELQGRVHCITLPEQNLREADAGGLVAKWRWDTMGDQIRGIVMEDAHG